MVDLGKVLAAIVDLQNELSEQSKQFHNLKAANVHLATQVMLLNAQVKRLPCMNSGGDDEPDTDPDCPALLSILPPRSRRDKLSSMSDDEPDSVLTRPTSVHAGMVTMRGPSVMVGAVVVLLGLIAAAVFVLRPAIAALVH